MMPMSGLHAHANLTCYLGTSIGPYPFLSFFPLFFGIKKIQYRFTFFFSFDMVNNIIIFYLNFKFFLIIMYLI
jgi:hypothetical protein